MSSVFLEKFVEKVKTAFPEVVAIYSFKKEIALFNSLLKNKQGVVVILNESDYYAETLVIFDYIYDTLQDELGWEGGVQFATSFSRGYIRTPSSFWHLNPLNPRCLLPEDMINVKKTGTLLYGQDILSSLEFPHKEEDLLKINIGLTKQEVMKIVENHSEYQPLIDPHVCWTRHEFAVPHPTMAIFQPIMVNFKEKEPYHKIIYLYGRYGGTGKTQIFYALMKYCKDCNLPFMYRTEFWKKEDGSWIDEDYNPANSPESLADWIITNAPSNHFVLFLDEVEFDYEIFKAKYEEKNYSPSILIFECGKDIPKNKQYYEIYDISVNYPYNEDDYRKILDTLLAKSNIDETIFLRESKEIIIKQARLWNHISFRRTPAVIVSAASLALIETIKICEETNQSISVMPDIAEKWALLVSSPWYQIYNEYHDVHAEFFIYDGKEYSTIDHNYHLPLP